MPYGLDTPEALAALYDEVIDDLYFLSEAHYYAGQLDTALAVLEHSMWLTETDEGRAALYQIQRAKLLIMRYFYNGRGYEEAHAMIKRAFQSLDIQEGGPVIADALQVRGLVHYYHALGGATDDFALAAGYFQDALAISEAEEDEKRQSDSLFHLGLVAEQTGHPDEAQSYYMRSWTLADRDHDRLEKSYAARHLGSLAEERGEIDKAYSYFAESLALREEIHFKIGLPLAHLAVGDALLAKGEASGALPHYEQASALADEMRLDLARVFSLLSLGAWHEAQRDRTQAKTYFQKAHAVACEMGQTHWIAETSGQLERIEQTNI